MIGDPRALIFREIDTDRLFQIKGWELKLGNENLWKLDLISFDSDILLDNLSLSSSEIVGTGEIYLGPNLKAEEIKLNGNYKVIVSNELPIVVIGDAVVPTNWINATIGYLNQIESNYELQVKIENGSEVEFINEN